MSYKASEGPRRTVRDKYDITSFVNAIMDANGGWIEMSQGDVSTPNMRNAVLIRVGAAVSEITVRDGVVYARMRT